MIKFQPFFFASRSTTENCVSGSRRRLEKVSGTIDFVCIVEFYSSVALDRPPIHRRWLRMCADSAERELSDREEGKTADNGKHTALKTAEISLASLIFNKVQV